MLCAVCALNPAVAQCTECKQPICGTCGIKCTRCHTFLCKAHTTRTPSGRDLCPQCMALRNAHMAAQAVLQQQQRPTVALNRSAETVAKTPAPAEPIEAFSFQSLQADLPPMPEPKFAPADLPRAEPDMEALLKKVADVDAINARMLGGSASRRTPIWVSSIFISGIALVFSMGVASSPQSVIILQPYLSYFIILLSLASICWAASGMTRTEDSRSERNRCTIGILLSLAALSIAVLYRHPAPVQPGAPARPPLSITQGRTRQ